MTEDEMVGWPHLLDGHEFKQAPGLGDRQGDLACCSPWGCKELTSLTNSTELGRGQVTFIQVLITLSSFTLLLRPNPS